jgi:hypothetical protein
MLAGVIEVHDLEGPGKLLVGQIPDPVGAVANEYFLLGAAPAAFDGLPVDARAKLCYPLDGPRYRWSSRRRGSLIPRRPTGFG